MSTGVPMRGRGSAGRLAMRRGGRFRGGAAGRGSPMSRGAGRGGITRGHYYFFNLKKGIICNLN